MLTPRSPMSVKSDSPSRPGGCSWRKMMSCSAPLQRPPGADAPLQRAPDAGADLGMAPPHLVENGDRPQARRALEQRHDLAVPNRSQRIRPPATTRRFLLRRQPRVLLDAIGGGGAEPGLGRGNDRRLGLAETHEQPHLAIGDVATGQGAVPHRREEPASYPAGHDRQTTRPLRGHADRRIRNVSRATPSCRHEPGDTFSSRLTRLSPCLPRRTDPVVSRRC